MFSLTTRVAHILVIVALFWQPVAAGSKTAKSESKQTLPKLWVQSLTWRSIGPANMGGRITSFAVCEKDPTVWWAASASGGLLKTTNNGTTFIHQFDHEATVSIGAVAVAPSDPNIVWVGTGEANPRNSVSWGDGVYRSTDGGQTWKNMGLKKTFQIGRIAIHPKNPNIVYVGALGRLWGSNDERGLYKTTDGGKTWKRILFVDDKTGVVDVQIDPKHPDTLLVATYRRQRDGVDSNDPAVKFGVGAGIYKSTNGGKTFRRITKGLPTCKLGRIGLCYFKRDPRHVYAIIESEKIGEVPTNFPHMGVYGEDADVGARITRVVSGGAAEKAGVKKGDIVIAVDGKIVHSYRELVDEIRKHAAGDKLQWEISRNRKSVKLDIVLGKPPKPKKTPDGKGPLPPLKQGRASSPFAASLGGQAANAQLQQGKQGFQYGGVFRSTDGGESWQRINSINPRPMYYSQIRVDPTDEKYIWVLGTRLYLSKDGGKTFASSAVTRQIHPDNHAMWIDPRDGRHVIIGNDGGIYVTYDRGAHWDHLNFVAIGQFYFVAVGPRRDYRVYGGLQDNGSWGGPNRSASGSGPGNTDWIRIGGGDGFVCAVDRDDPDLVYFESQGGVTGRINLRTGQRASLRPRAPKGVQYRFNWKTPFILSPHNSKIYYSAGNYVFRSPYEGKNLKVISPDITLTKKGTASALAESFTECGVLYVGTTDGALWITRDGGHQWTNIYGKPKQKNTKATPKNASQKKSKAGSQAAGKSAAAKKHAVQATNKTPPQTKSTKAKQTVPSPAPPGKSLAALIPGPCWVSSIEPSHFKSGRVYITLDGHRSDDDAPYVFVSEDYGKTWRSLVADLPAGVGSTRVIREDLYDEDLLYLGTEFGIWVTIDRGASWTRLNSNLPTVAVHEIAIHPSAGEIVAATHGRSLWILDVSALRQTTAKTLDEAVHLYRPHPAIKWRRRPSRGSAGTRQFIGQNPPFGAVIYYWLAKPAQEVELTITDIEGKVVRRLDGKLDRGLHIVNWDLRRTIRTRRGRRVSGNLVDAGKYLLTLTVDDQKYTQVIEVQDDPNAP